MTRWKLFFLLSSLVALLSAAAYSLAPETVTALQSTVRVTARAAFVLFLVAFTASPLVQLAPSALTRALVRERRYFGLSFAFAHFLHALVLIAYVHVAPEAFWTGRTPASNVPGSIGYVAIVALTATSFGAAMRWLGPDRWKRLHRIGVWIIAVIFAASFLSRIPHGAGYAVPGVVMLAAMLLRVVAHSTDWQRKRAAVVSR